MLLDPLFSSINPDPDENDKYLYRTAGQNSVLFLCLGFQGNVGPLHFSSSKRTPDSALQCNLPSYC